jgi:DNA topoisomerase-1
MGQQLLIVESPAKAKTIGKYLGKDFIVLSSRGHVRGIPSKSDAVMPEKNFTIEYEINPGSDKYLDPIAKAAKEAEEIFLATDPDREGEAIAWHLVEVLKDKGIKLPKTHRITFNEVTAQAIKKALKSPRELDQNLISAQRTRQALDYLVGFSLSPVLWRKLPGSRSAGRVQSVALKVLCEREEEIAQFRSRDYWTLEGNFTTKNSNNYFKAELSELFGEKVEKFTFTQEEEASGVLSYLEGLDYKVLSLEKKEVQKNPDAPFITSTLIQAASSQLKLSSKKTMQIAQKLYEGLKIKDKMTGLITYMRTDSTNISTDALEKVREVITKLFGEKYLPKSPRAFKNKVKNAQEAHEAIRPTDPDLTPDQVKDYLSSEELSLYDLIWSRFIACQMAPALLAKTHLTIIASSENKKIPSEIEKFSTKNKEILLKTTGSLLLFDGFQKVFQSENKKDEILLPSLVEGQDLIAKSLDSIKHTTTAPSRYSEASLVKKMEELGIGRPSTYATILSILQERNYVNLNKNKFFVEDRGELVNKFLSTFFTQYLQYDFTALLEEELDQIAEGTKENLKFLSDFWEPFKLKVEEVLTIQTTKILEVLQEELAGFLFENPDNRICPKCNKGELKLKNSKYAPFIGCSLYPDCDYAEKFKLFNRNKEEKKDEQSAVDFIREEKKAQPIDAKILAKNQEEQILLCQGPYGPYLGLSKEGTLEKTMSLTKLEGLEELPEMSFNQLEFFFSLPKSLGKDATSQEIKLGIGKYGPYLLYKKKFTAIKNKNIRYLIQISLEEAKILLKIT